MSRLAASFKPLLLKVKRERALPLVTNHRSFNIPQKCFENSNCYRWVVKKEILWPVPKVDCYFSDKAVESQSLALISA
jgi:hypothetical protein